MARVHYLEDVRWAALWSLLLKSSRRMMSISIKSVEEQVVMAGVEAENPGDTRINSAVRLTKSG